METESEREKKKKKKNTHTRTRTRTHTHTHTVERQRQRVETERQTPEVGSDRQTDNVKERSYEGEMESSAGSHRSRDRLSEKVTEITSLTFSLLICMCPFVKGL